MTKTKYKTISIPEKLYDKIDELIDGTGFPNVSQFVCFMIREILSESRNEYDKEVEKKVKQKLRSLGYLK